ncbi:MAG TPA: hypothetical protein VMT34_15505 [Aggregatilineales bacterium]|nr:hypothetical protein [Aggregatilineales bacterium]
MSDAENQLRQLLRAALQTGDSSALESYLEAHSGLPGPRGNLELMHRFADEAAAQGDSVLPLLERWSALTIDEAPVNSAREILVAAAAEAYAPIAIAQPDRRDGMQAHLRRAASDPRWRTRELVAMAMQRLLSHDWAATLAVLRAWAVDSDPLLVRAAAASIAEPPVLTDEARGREAVAIQALAVERFRSFEFSKAESVRTLRQALGFTISVATVPAPEAGFALLGQMAASGDPDLRWIVRENLKKNRLNKWPDRVASVAASLDASR